MSPVSVRISLHTYRLQTRGPGSSDQTKPGQHMLVVAGQPAKDKGGHTPPPPPPPSHIPYIPPPSLPPTPHHSSPLEQNCINNKYVRLCRLSARYNNTAIRPLIVLICFDSLRGEERGEEVMISSQDVCISTP